MTGSANEVKEHSDTDYIRNIKELVEHTATCTFPDIPDLDRAKDTVEWFAGKFLFERPEMVELWWDDEQ